MNASSTYIKGLNYLDERLTRLLSPPSPGSLDAAALPQSHQQLVDQVTRSLRSSRPSSPVVHLLGADSPSKSSIAEHACAGLNLNLYRLSAGMIPSGPGEVEELARLWTRESLLVPIALYVDADDSGSETASYRRLLARLGGAVFLSTREVAPGLKRTTLAIDVFKPTKSEQYAAWRQALGDAGGQAPESLAAQFDLSLTAIRQAVATVEAADAGEAGPERLWRQCQIASRPRLDSLAQRLDAKATWKQIVLAGAEESLLRRIASQVRRRTTVYERWGFARRMNRGLGISVLFAGESGTGKTMAAEVIANELQLDLYRIDLSAVVSKYIGETEKNLRRVFDAAEDGGALLFFDEADALFGKRSEVKDSHDRYANIEINYLLQRIEAYRGLAVLATNMKNALDRAFLRRLRFIVTFAFPGAAERRRIWEGAFPPETPTKDLDYERLARLSLTGGSIHNIALSAAFMAAETDADVTMPLVLEAARSEFRKIEKPVNEAELRWERSAEAVA